MSALAAGRVIVQLFGIRLFCSDMGMNWDVKQVAPKKKNCLLILAGFAHHVLRLRIRPGQEHLA